MDGNAGRVTTRRELALVLTPAGREGPVGVRIRSGRNTRVAHPRCCPWPPAHDTHRSTLIGDRRIAASAT
jgi:hypothetical protein